MVKLADAKEICDFVVQVIDNFYVGRLLSKEN